jgi:hypothetical protein
VHFHTRLEIESKVCQQERDSQALWQESQQTTYPRNPVSKPPVREHCHS